MTDTITERLNNVKRLLADPVEAIDISLALENIDVDLQTISSAETDAGLDYQRDIDILKTQIKDDVAHQRLDRLGTLITAALLKAGQQGWATRANPYFAACVDAGIYPAAMNGVPRTEEESGWNRGVMHIAQTASKYIKNGIPIVDDDNPVIDDTSPPSSQEG